MIKTFFKLLAGFFFGLLLIAALVTGVSAIAAGTTATVRWEAPTTYTDGSALPATDIAFYSLKWGTEVRQVIGLTSVVTVPCGETVFSVSVTTKAGAKYPNATSGDSASIPYATGVSCVPNPPKAVTVE